MTKAAAARKARLSALAALCPDSRGRRFARRRAGEPAPRFADLAAVPDWITLPSAMQQDVAVAAALIAARPAIDREIDGARLAALAAVAGEALFDRVCSENLTGDMGGAAGTLPRPDLLPMIGARILEAALPPAFGGSYPAAAGDDRALQIAQKAVALATGAR